MFGGQGAEKNKQLLINVLQRFDRHLTKPAVHVYEKTVVTTAAI